MPAPKGNKYWQLRSRHGKPKIYTPSSLWKKACEYFQWIDENPIEEIETKTNGDNKTIKITKHAKPYTESGMCVFMNINTDTWTDYCSNKNGYEDYSVVSMTIKNIIKTQKFEGAATGLFNASIIARDIGLSEKIEHKHNILEIDWT